MAAVCVELRTERLVLRPVQAGDAATMIACLSGLEVAGWLATVPHPYGAAEFAAFLAEIAVPGETFAIVDGEGVAGCVQLGRDLGYWVAPRAQGRGYATEAAEALIAAHFAAGGDAVRSGHFLGNARSARVLAKLGFVQTGRRRVTCLALGRRRAHVDMVLTAAGFAARGGGGRSGNPGPPGGAVGGKA